MNQCFMRKIGNKMAFKQVYEHDDWGYIYYDFTKGGMSNSANHVKSLTKGKYVTVKFKSGYVGKYKIVSIPYHTTINDMGHEYSVSGERLAIKEQVRGIPVFVTLDKLKVLVDD